MNTFKCIITNPWLNLLVGLLFLYSGVSESYFELKEIRAFEVGAHHGVILFAFLHILKTLPEFFEGMECVVEAHEDLDHKAD